MAPFEPPSGDVNPYSAPTSEAGSAAPLEVTGGIEFRGELTAEDRERASRLHAGAAPISGWLLGALLLSPFVLAFLAGWAPILVGLLVLLMLCLSLLGAWSKSAYWKTFRLDLPWGPFAGRASHQGLRFESANWNKQFAWSEVGGYLADEEIVVLYVEGWAIAIPRWAFASESAWAQFCETLLRSGVRTRIPLNTAWPHSVRSQ